MARRKSLNIPGHAHELTCGCYRGYPFLLAERTRQWLAKEIDAAREKHDLAVWAFVIMPEHLHLVVFPYQKTYDMSAILKDIKRPVGAAAIRHLEDHDPAWLPKVTRTRGRRTERLFWQSGGGYDRNIDNPRTLWSMIDYIHNNPVRRGLVRRAVDWTWSSAAWYEQGESPIAIDPMPEAWAANSC